MKLIELFIILLLTANLFTDFNRDKGEHKKAKQFHFVCVLLLAFSFSKVLNYFLAVFGRFDEVRELHEIPVGILSPQLSLWAFMANTVLTTVLMFIVFRLVRRRETARKLLIYIIPALIITQTIGFYKGFIGGEVIDGMRHWVVFLTGFIIMASAGIMILVIYNQAFMKAFFLTVPKQKQASEPGEESPIK